MVIHYIQRDVSVFDAYKDTLQMQYDSLHENSNVFETKMDCTLSSHYEVYKSVLLILDTDLFHLKYFLTVEVILFHQYH